MNKELEEAITYLKETILIYKNTIPKLSKAIEKLLNYIDNSISKEKHEKLKEHCKTLIKEKQELSTALLESIPKEVIEKEIEELDKCKSKKVYKNKDTISKSLENMRTITINSKKQALQELLEGK